MVNVKKFEILHQLDTSFMANFNCVSNFLLFDIYVFENDGKLIEFWTGTKSEASSEKEELFSSSSSLLFSPKKVIVFFFKSAQLSTSLQFNCWYGMRDRARKKQPSPFSLVTGYPQRWFLKSFHEAEHLYRSDFSAALYPSDNSVIESFHE